jgi:parvulin-like peptidyl-prolyl isomerase
MRNLTSRSVLALFTAFVVSSCDRGPEPSFQPDEVPSGEATGTVEPTPAEEPTGAEPPGADTAPASVAARHILIKYKGATRAGPDATRTKDEARSLAEEVLGKAKADGADFEALAREHSEGPTGPRGGDLGTFRPGQMVPAFDQAAFALDVGEVSGVVETPFGFHVIQRYE